ICQPVLESGRDVLAACRFHPVIALVVATRDARHHLHEPVYIALVVVAAETGPHHARHTRAVAGENPVSPRAGLVFAELQQVDHVGMGAETATAHADAPFITEDGGEQEVIDSFDVERDDAYLFVGQRRVGLPVDAHAGDRAQLAQGIADQRFLVSGNRIHAHAHHRLRRRRPRHRADEVGPAGLLPVGQAGPVDLILGHDVYRAAARVLWSAL